MEIKIQFENYKLLEKKEFELSGSNVYLVQGGNEKGKTSFIAGLLSLISAKDTTKEPVTKGKEEGKIVGYITLPDGLEYIIKFDFTNEKNQFTLIRPDGTKSKKVNDIRELFQYNAFTADEFLSWSETADGRKKQKNIILSLLSQKDQEKYVKAETAERMAYNDRTALNANHVALKAIYDNIMPVSAEKLEHIKRIDEIEDGLAGLKERYDKVTEVVYKNNKLDQLTKTLTEVAAELDGLDIAHNLPNEITHINAFKKEVESKEELKARIDKGEGVVRELRLLEAKIKQDNATKEQLKESSLKATEAEHAVEKARKAKNDVIINAKLPFTDISIDEDGISIVTPKGNVPFNSNQVSTSRVMKLVTKIILLLNPKTPIVCLGRGESFDPDSLNQLALFAEENNACIIVDKVLAGPLEVVGYESK